MISIRLKELMAKCGDTKVGLAEAIGLSDQTIANVLRGADLKVSSLKRIADYFNVPVGYFFDETPMNQKAIATGIGATAAINSTVSSIDFQMAQEKISHLEALLAEKERLIQILINK